MFSKKALSAAIAGSIAAGFVTSSQAIVYVNPTEAVTTTIASPTVLGTNNVIINGVGANDFRLSGSDSFGTALNPVYVKVTLTNATFNAAVDSPAFGDGTNGLVVASQITTPFVGSGLTGQRSVTFVSGGAAGGSTVTYQVANPGASDDFTFDMPSLRTSGTSNVEVKVEVLDSLSATSALKTFTLTNSAGAVPLITLTDNVISSGASSQTLTAAVANQFKQFSSNGGNLGGTRGTFGTASFGVVSSAFVASTGAAAASIDTLASDTSSVVTVSGDLSVGTWYFAAAGGTNCAGSTAAGATAITLNTAKTSGTTTLASFRGTAATNPERTLCVDHNGTTAIPLNSAITVALTPAKANSLAIATPATPATRTLGVVTRDGTTVQIPYVTTFADYTQRLTIMNRGTADAPFTISFRTETGTTADTTGKLTGGTVAAGKTGIYKLSDFVNFTGTSTRGSATVVIDAVSTAVSVSTTTVNAADKGTDTVTLQQ